LEPHFLIGKKRKFFTLKQFLENILGMRIDLATRNSLKPQMKEVVLKDVTYV